MLKSTDSSRFQKLESKIESTINLIIVDVNKRKLIIKSCRNLETKLKIKLENNIRIKQIVKIKRSLVIVAYFVFEVLIIVRDEILLNKNYFFRIDFVRCLLLYCKQKNVFRMHS